MFAMMISSEALMKIKRDNMAMMMTNGGLRKAKDDCNSGGIDGLR